MSADNIVEWYVEEHGHVIAKCPGCGRWGTLAKGVHKVAVDGSLSPSFDCPHCPFHEWVRLIHWPSAPARRECGTCEHCEIEPDPGTYGTCTWAHAQKLPFWMQPNNEDGVMLDNGEDCRCWSARRALGEEGRNG